MTLPKLSDLLYEMSDVIEIDRSGQRNLAVEPTDNTSLDVAVQKEMINSFGDLKLRRGFGTFYKAFENIVLNTIRSMKQTQVPSEFQFKWLSLVRGILNNMNYLGVVALAYDASRKDPNQDRVMITKATGTFVNSQSSVANEKLAQELQQTVPYVDDLIGLQEQYAPYIIEAVFKMDTKGKLAILSDLKTQAGTKQKLAQALQQKQENIGTAETLRPPTSQQQQQQKPSPPKFNPTTGLPITRPSLV